MNRKILAANEKITRQTPITIRAVQLATQFKANPTELPGDLENNLKDSKAQQLCSAILQQMIKDNHYGDAINFVALLAVQNRLTDKKRQIQRPDIAVPRAILPIELESKIGLENPGMLYAISKLTRELTAVYHDINSQMPKMAENELLRATANFLNETTLASFTLDSVNIAAQTLKAVMDSAGPQNTLYNDIKPYYDILINPQQSDKQKLIELQSMLEAGEHKNLAPIIIDLNQRRHAMFAGLGNNPI